MALRLCIPDQDWNTSEDNSPKVAVSKRNVRSRRFPASLVCLLAPLALLPFFFPVVTSTNLGVTQSQLSHPALSLTAGKAEKSHGFIKVYGLISNTSHTSYRNVEALVQLQNSEGQALQIKSAVLPITIFKSGSKSAFKVDMPAVAGAFRCVVHFKTVSGKWLG